MSKYSSDSNSRDRTRSYNRYYNQRHRSSSSSSTESSRYSRKHNSTRSDSKHYKKSKYKHRSNSSSDYSSSRHKHSTHSHYKDGSRSKRKHRRRSPSTSTESNHSGSTFKDSQSKSSKTSHDNEKKKISPPDTTIQTYKTVKNKDEETNWAEKNVYDVMKRENSIELIKQEGFVFKLFKRTNEKKEENNTYTQNVDISKLPNDIISSLPIEQSTFIISSSHRFLCPRYKLLTKRERCQIWAKKLFASYRPSEDCKK